MPEYSNVRDDSVLGPCIGQRVVDITQHDKDEWQKTRVAYVTLHFENGVSVTFYIHDEGFSIETCGDEEDGDGPGDGCAPAGE